MRCFHFYMHFLIFTMLHINNAVRGWACIQCLLMQEMPQTQTPEDGLVGERCRGPRLLEILEECPEEPPGTTGSPGLEESWSAGTLDAGDGPASALWATWLIYVFCPLPSCSEAVSEPQKVTSRQLVGLQTNCSLPPGVFAAQLPTRKPVLCTWLLHPPPPPICLPPHPTPPQHRGRSAGSSALGSKRELGKPAGFVHLCVLHLQ